MTGASSRMARMASSLLRVSCAITLILAANGQAAMAQGTKEIRLTPDSFDFSRAGIAGAGTSGLAGIRTIVLKGDPTRPGLYTILLRVPAHTRIAAHRHPDDRIATVVAGTWYFGYGHTADTTALRALPPGSFYTEPPNEDHFAETRDTDVMVQITGLGPTGTVYASTKKDPRH
jgi:quercetin dioxygenase-like cupin family protein